jgi:DNA-binding response OmpR family regulator
LIDLLPIDENRIQSYEDAHLIVDFQSETVRLDGQLLRLTRKEFALLAFLTRRAGDLVSRDALMTQVWNYNLEIRTRTVDVHIRRLRRNLGLYGKLYIETIFGVGYRFQPRYADNPSPAELVSRALWLGTEAQERISAARN